jgi:hypothetical protein
VLRLLFALLLTFSIAACDGDDDSSDSSSDRELSVELSLLGTYETGVYDEAGAEISAYDPATKRLFFINAEAGLIEVLDYSDPSAPSLIKTVDVAAGMGGVNSVAARDGVVACAVEADEKTDNGQVVFIDSDGNELKRVNAGALPDMITFTPDGKYVLTANEGEPNEDYSVDPAGTVSIIDISGGLENAAVINVGFTEADMTGSNPVRIKDGADFANDAEPEYISISDDSAYAFVTLQENNAVAKIDIAGKSVVYVKGLGYKDHSVEGYGMDASDDGVAEIATLNVKGMYMPDSIASFHANGSTYFITANEGDGREYGDYEDEVKVKKIDLDPSFPDSEVFAEKYEDLVISAVNGDTDGDGDYDVLYTFGARSFTIWDADINYVYDSGDAFEQYLSTDNATKDYFNASSTDNVLDSRSPKKGPEPEGAETAVIDGKTIAFIGLERAGGIMVYEVTDPAAPRFLTYASNRNFECETDEDGDIVDFEAAKDLAPEGLLFISAEDSPTGRPLLVVCSEVSGTVSAYEIITN